MKKTYMSMIALFAFTAFSWAQNPGLVISEFLQNPGGLDSPLEYVELLATDDIDFTTTPYTVIVSNNGTATADGWIEGGSITYAFEITTGSVSTGDVVYVGGTGMAPTGTQLRVIDTGSDDGDGGIGNSNSGGVFGNGGGNGDGIAIFDMAIGSITAATAPVDAVMYGSGLGGAVIDAATGYEMPVNDHYDGGKLVGDDFVALDADLTIVSGTFDLGTESFTVPRTFSSGAGTDGVSNIELLEVTPPVFSFIVEDSTVLENAGTIDLAFELINANGTASTADVTIITGSTASSPDDFILIDTTISFVGDLDGEASFSIEVVDDMLEENSEYIIITLDNLVNAELDDKTEMFLYITDNDRVIPTATNELKLDLLTSFSTGTEELSSAEIVVFDTTTMQLFVANSIANQVDVIDFSVPAVPVLVDSIEFDSVGFINSVAVYGDILAVAVQAPIAQDSGFVSFWNTDGTFLNRLTVGALPDMIAFNHAGTQLVAACEGEPSDDYTVDPNGGVSIIELTDDIAALTEADITNLDFTAFDAMEEELTEAGVRIFGLDASVAQDLEPEFVTILEDDVTAHIVLQENNAIAVVDLVAKEIIEVRALGTIDHSVAGYGLDASNRTSGINIANFPIKGMFMPDAIDNITVLGTTYLVTANEGDARDYDGYSEEERVDDLNLDETVFPNAQYLQNSRLLGRLKTTTVNGDTDGDGDFDEIYSYGTRSFSIWDEATGDLVFDSGDLIEQIIANDPTYAELFNAHNEGGELELKDRSDDKGPEPEGVVTTMIDGNAYLFVSLERVGGAMAFNINDPANPVYIGYHNNRDAETNGPDRGAEGMIFIDETISPDGTSLLVLANEVSSTLTIYAVNSCLAISDLEVTTADDVTAFCVGDSLEITADSEGELTLQWLLGGEAIADATETTVFATSAGNYQLRFENEDELCAGLTDSLFITVNELPIVDATVTADSICFGETVTFSSTGAESYAWDVDGVVNDEPYTPVVTGPVNYTVIGEDENGCENTASVEVNMAEEIEIVTTVTDEIFGDDATIDLTVDGGFGDYIFDWDNDGTGDFDDDEDLSDLSAGTYIVVVEDEFGCQTTQTVEVNSQVSISEESKAIISVYPNPTSNHLFVELEGAFTYQLMNMNGQIMNAGNAYNKASLSLANFATGIYFIRLTNETGTLQTLKITKK